jgi:hypothetical protein
MPTTVLGCAWARLRHVTTPNERSFFMEGIKVLTESSGVNPAQHHSSPK